METEVTVSNMFRDGRNPSTANQDEEAEMKGHLNSVENIFIKEEIDIHSENELDTIKQELLEENSANVNTSSDIWLKDGLVFPPETKEEMCEEETEELYGKNEEHTYSKRRSSFADIVKNRSYENVEMKEMNMEDYPDEVKGHKPSKIANKLSETTNDWKFDGRFYPRCNVEVILDVNGVFYKCKECTFKTNLPLDVSKHFRSKHNVNSKVYKCEDCKFESKYKRDLKKHRSTQHDLNSELHKCGHCEFASKYKYHLAEHIKVKHDVTSETHKCKECTFETKYSYKLGAHMRIKHTEDSKSYKCTHCTYETKYKSDLRKHVIMKHDENAELYRCEYCPLETKYKINLMKHMKIKHGGNCKLYKCKDCTYESKYKHHLTRHMKIMHDGNAEIYKCKDCTYKSKYKHHLKIHGRKQHAKAPKTADGVL